MAAITLTEYTDPWCTWCWGSEPILRHILELYGEKLELGFVTGGLVEDFAEFHDRSNDISEPEHVAPHWREASERHGMPVDVSIWTEDPPQSTYPSNVAYHAAKIVAPEQADAFLRRMREAAAAEARNTTRLPVLLDLVGDVGIERQAFRDAFNGDEAQRRFEEDLADAEEHDARAFPTFHVETGEDEGWFRGYRPFRFFEQVFDEAGVEPVRDEPRDMEAFIAEWGRVATQEIAETYGMEEPEARERLETLADAGVVEETPVGNGAFWDAV